MKSKMKSWVVLVFGLMILILNATASPPNFINCQEAFDQVAILVNLFCSVLLSHLLAKPVVKVQNF